MDPSAAETDTLDLLDAYLAELHAGHQPDRDRWLASYRTSPLISIASISSTGSHRRRSIRMRPLTALAPSDHR